MYQGSHAKPKKHSKVRMNKLSILIIAVVILVGAVVGTSVAFLVSRTDDVVNSFTYGTISTEIHEDFDYAVKQNVQIKNTGNTDAFIRATYIITWRDGQGADAKIVPTSALPKGYSYTLEDSTGAWTKSGEYYYYKYAVPSGELTGGSLLKCTVSYPQDVEPAYFLNVEVIAEAIQSTPEQAVKDAWGAGFGIDADGNLIVPTV